MEGNQTLTLALVWQLMRAYTLSLLSKVFVTSDQGLVATNAFHEIQILYLFYNLTLLSKLNEDGTPIVESEIISWANNKVL